jgi:hypothetical protein
MNGKNAFDKSVTALEHETIRRVIAHGVGIKDFYDKSPDNAPESYLLDLALWRPGGRYKAFIRGRFLVLDIDRKPADLAADPERGDGLKNFERWLESVGKPRNMRPPELRDIEAGSFPCFVSTPSGGLHLYFTYAGPPITGILTTHVEVKTWTITAPGSVRDGKSYVLRGDFDAAPPLPRFIETRLPKATQPEPRFTPLKKTAFPEKPSWEKITEWTDTDGWGEGGRNNWAYSAARHAQSHEWTRADTLDALRNEPRVDGLPDQEIISAVDSAYRKTT